MCISWDSHHGWCGFHTSVDVDSCQNCQSLNHSEAARTACVLVYQQQQQRRQIQPQEHASHQPVQSVWSKVFTVKQTRLTQTETVKAAEHSVWSDRRNLKDTLLVQKLPVPLRPSASPQPITQWFSGKLQAASKALLTVLGVNVSCLLRCLVNKCYNSRSNGLGWF